MRTGTQAESVVVYFCFAHRVHSIVGRPYSENEQAVQALRLYAVDAWKRRKAEAFN